MRKRNRLWMCVWLAAGMAGCGDDSGTPDGGAQSMEDAGERQDDGGPRGFDGGFGEKPKEDGGSSQAAVACTADFACEFGDCDDSTGALVCLCQPGWDGDACDECAPGHEGPDCGLCSEGYIPSGVRVRACIEDPCLEVECGSHGSCTVIEDTALCDCATGWAGETCDTCAAGYEGEACGSCALGYEQPDPSVGECVSGVCLDVDCGQGQCVPDGDAASCECDTGWAGDSCDACALGYLARRGTCVLELPVQNDKLMLWMDATENVSVGRGGVYAWESRVGSRPPRAVQATGGSRPQLVTAGGQTFLRFDGDNDFLPIASLRIDEPTYSLFIAARPSKTAGSQGLIGGVDPESPNNHGLVVRSQNSAERIQYMHRAPFSLTGTDGSIAADGFPTSGLPQPFQVVTVERRDGDEGLVQVIRGGSNHQTFPTDQPAFDSSMQILLGSRTAGADFLDGDLGEVILYAGTISEDERAAVEAYLKARWKVGRLIVVLPVRDLALAN